MRIITVLLAGTLLVAGCSGSSAMDETVELEPLIFEIELVRPTAAEIAGFEATYARLPANPSRSDAFEAVRKAQISVGKFGMEWHGNDFGVLTFQGEAYPIADALRGVFGPLFRYEVGGLPYPRGTTRFASDPCQVLDPERGASPLVVVDAELDDAGSVIVSLQNMGDQRILMRNQRFVRLAHPGESVPITRHFGIMSAEIRPPFVLSPDEVTVLPPLPLVLGSCTDSGEILPKAGAYELLMPVFLGQDIDDLPVQFEPIRVPIELVLIEHGTP